MEPGECWWTCELSIRRAVLVHGSLAFTGTVEGTDGALDLDQRPLLRGLAGL